MKNYFKVNKVICILFINTFIPRGLISNRRNDSSRYLLTRQSTFTSRQNTVRYSVKKYSVKS